MGTRRPLYIQGLIVPGSCSETLICPVAGPEGARSNPLGDIFHFHGGFSEKSGKINKLSRKINKAKSHCKFEPPSRNAYLHKAAFHQNLHRLL